MERLASNVSELSLEGTGVGGGSTTGRRGRRPNRAYHNIQGSTISNQGTPLSTPKLDAGHFGTPHMSTPVLSPPQATFAYNASPQGAPPYVGAGPLVSPYTASSPALQTMNSPELNSSAPVVTSADLKQAQPFYTTSHLVPTQRWEDQLRYLNTSVETSTLSVPPLPTTAYYCADQGSSDPRLMSVSMYNIPATEQLRSATKLPLGATIQPFADLIPEDPAPLVQLTNDVLQGPSNMDAMGPVRCPRCRAYANPKFQFTYDSKMICNICRVKSNIPQQSLEQTYGQKVNMASSIEVMRGTVDFMVPAIYNAHRDKPPVPLHYVFLIDMSTLANENGSSLSFLEAVKSTIEYIAGNQPECKIAIMGYDNKLRFYNLSNTLESAKEFLMSEIDDIFLPFVEGLFAKPASSMHIINDTIQKISDYINNEKFGHVPQVCYGPALQAAKVALDTFTNGQGGKIICSLNSIPNIGPGNLSIRKDDAQKKSLKCDNEFYHKLGHQFLKSYVSLDLYLTSGGFVDLSSVAYPVEITSGKLEYLPQFDPRAHEGALVNGMIQNVANIVGYQCILKMRCSSGLSVREYYLEASEGSDREPVVPVITKDTTIDVLLKYDDKLKQGTDVHFQAAFLYTDLNGVRKVRSINTSALVSTNIRDVFKFLNQNVITRIMIKDVLDTLKDCDFAKIRATIDSKIVDVLTQYRALVNGNSSSQLVLPDSLKTLPTYMLTFQKGELMKPNTRSTRGNERVYDLFEYRKMNSAQLCFKLYPQVVPLHVMLEEVDLTFYDTNDRLLQITPESTGVLSVRNAHANFTNGGCYLIFDGSRVYLWFNENTNKILLQDLVGIDPSISYNQVVMQEDSLPQTGTAINAKANALIKNWCNLTQKSYLPVVPLRRNLDQYYSNVMGQLLCEDKTVNMIDSYDSYFVRLHRSIQEKLKNEDFTKVSSRKYSDTMHQKFVQY